jgi:hypothetical protein
MFNSSLVGSVMNMSAEVYSQQNTQNSNTGAIVREWSYRSVVPCKIEPIKLSGTGMRTDTKSFNDSKSLQLGYDEKFQLKMKTLELMSKRWRVSGVRSSDGKQVYVEFDKIDQPDTIFEVIASHAVLDPFGRISYYETVLQRVSVQDNDKTISN